MESGKPGRKGHWSGQGLGFLQGALVHRITVLCLGWDRSYRLSRQLAAEDLLISRARSMSFSRLMSRRSPIRCHMWRRSSVQTFAAGDLGEGTSPQPGHG